MRGVIVLWIAVFAVSAPHAQPLDAGVPLTVVVSDTGGGRVADATVVLTGAARRHTATTRPDGLAIFANVPAGAWTLSVTRDGFSPFQGTVTAGSGTRQVPVTLGVAAYATEVEVAARAGGPPSPIRLDIPASGGTWLDIPVRELPASLFQVGQDLIQERGARSVEEAVRLAPGMQSSTGVGSIPGYSTRGWSGNSVSLMRDGVRQNSNSQSSRPVDAFLLDRIEILKGPASLLFGEGAIGGAVNLVSKSPISEVSAESLLAYGSHGEYRAGVGLNVPIRKNLFARVDVSQSGSDGYVGDSPQKLVAAAASLRWLPTSNVHVKGAGTYTYDNTSAYYSTPFVNGAFDPRMRDINYNMQDRLTKSHNKWLQLDADVMLRGGWQVHNGFFASTHALDWRNFEGYAYNAATDTVDVSSYFLIWRNDLLLGNRFDVRNTFDLRGRSLSIVAGGEVQRNDMQRAGNPSPNFVLPVRKLDPFNPQPHLDPGYDYVRQRDVLIDTNALFAEGVVDVTSRLKLVGGVRWEQIELAYTPYPSRQTASTVYGPSTGRAGAVFSVTGNTNLYASYSRAVEPTTQLASLDGSQQRFSLVPGSQLEAGAKGDAFGGRLTGTFAYFAIAKRDLLITQLIDGVQTAQQIGEQTSHGIEGTIVARPTPTLTLSGDVAYTGAEFVDFIEIAGGVNTDRSGNTPPNVPQVIWNVSPTQQIGPFSVTATVRQVGRRWGDNANTRRVSGFTTLDAAVSYRLSRGTQVTVRGRNLTDEIYTQSVSNTAGRLEPPRSVDVTLTTDLRGLFRR